MNASVSNAYLIALPIVIAFVGVKAAVPITVTVVSILLFYVTVITFLLEYCIDLYRTLISIHCGALFLVLIN